MTKTAADSLAQIDLLLIKFFHSIPELTAGQFPQDIIFVDNVHCQVVFWPIWKVIRRIRSTAFELHQVPNTHGFALRIRIDYRVWKRIKCSNFSDLRETVGMTTIVAVQLYY